jgi:hypothetical protein
MCLAAVTFIVFLVQTIRLAPATHIVLESLFFQCRLCVWHSLHLLFSDADNVSGSQNIYYFSNADYVSGSHIGFVATKITKR